MFCVLEIPLECSEQVIIAPLESSVAKAAYFSAEKQYRSLLSLDTADSSKELVTPLTKAIANMKLTACSIGRGLDRVVRRIRLNSMMVTGIVPILFELTGNLLYRKKRSNLSTNGA